MTRKLSIRQRLRAAVWEMTSATCEWPDCGRHAVELAHIHPRGMGHNGYRDTLANVMAACWLHARVTDDLSHDEWWPTRPFAQTADDQRRMLADMIAMGRSESGFDVAAMQTELDAMP